MIASEDFAHENNSYGEDIGGLDYPTKAEPDLSIYEDLFFSAKQYENQGFDPSKMNDTVAVYLISPWSNCFTMPVTENKINSDYGWRRGRFHSGMDLDLEIGDQVYATFDGIVEKAEYYSDYGNLVIMKHFNGLETYYAHLSKFEACVGDTICAGEPIGLGGSTGRSTGPHLHYEVRYRGVAIDPKYLIDFTGDDLKSDVFFLNKNHFRPTQQSLSTSANAAKYYTIRKGDTLTRIASKNNTTVSRICKLNHISSKKLLKPGMKLRVK